MKIKAISVFTRGDVTAGMGSENASILADGDFLIDLSIYPENSRESALSTFLADIEKAFSTLWGERAYAIVEQSDEGSTSCENCGATMECSGRGTATQSDGSDVNWDNYKCPVCSHMQTDI
ncbi:hypothetical protein [Aeromonas sp. MrichA-1]|uniref:hypothetical protein n=1 Tax=Aeromonas sp. MrichA-1 TaxID=2823362 RepID=UPI001B32C24D|nr:hypothetical protein [Aeromonas sp. MrichA-1]MBP4081902.1 hypothetical protein [Aeromonas sp. MrichA-1]